MTKIRLNHTLLFTFIAAFLAMQWTTTHIHLAEHHDHDGSHHQHKVEVHAHQSIDNHVSYTDLSHQPNSLNVVELDHEFSTQKLEKPSTFFIALTFPQLSFSIPNATELPTNFNTQLNYLYRSTAKPRGPPAYS